ncbi:fatty acid synthase subunit beta domain-containing protein [Hoyosella subflava]|uniref:fatty acid synthase subunit beta domain-containing protein n=1 Tax=Hoyosella subflava TaxID=639313 RepID=UPI003899428C
MSDHPTFSSRSSQTANNTLALAAQFRSGTSYTISFGGQGAEWLPAIRELIHDGGFAPELTDLVSEANAMLAPVEAELQIVRSEFSPLQWAEEPEAGIDTQTAAISLPGVFLAQLAALRLLELEGLDTVEVAPAGAAGHSQGVLGVEVLRQGGTRNAELLAIAQLMGAAASLTGRRRGLRSVGSHSAMVSVSKVDPQRIADIVAEATSGMHPDLAPVVAIRNGRRRVVISGRPEQIERIRLRCAEIAAKEKEERAERTRGGEIFAPVFDPIAAEVAFHHPSMSAAVELAVEWAEECGIDTDLTRSLATSALVDPVDWVAEVERLADTGAKWLLDVGPGDVFARLTASSVRGLGIAVVPAGTRGGHRNLFTPGAAPEAPSPWTRFAPRVVQLPDGTKVAETRFSRLTGRSPIVLAGMTPTTVDAKIVAAAANAGYWSELAGGGQVTESIFNNRVEDLKKILDPGRSVQLNAMFLDPYLWKLHVGGKRLLQKARVAGAPFDGVTITAGIPELDDALSIIEDLNNAGLSYIAFKPGTVTQIRSVIRIAAEVPHQTVIVQIEGGKAGGHHSWEDLDDLLLETYAELRSRPNVVIAAGGGIGTPERAADYLTGRWSVAHGFPAMPVDSILIGTAAMAALEATTSPEVKKLLVETQGTPDWIPAGGAENGMSSGRSQLGADIHEVDNTASKTGRLLDEVAGDAAAVKRRRDEIVAALNGTAKPYFGDVAEMTYKEWLERYVELTVGAAEHAFDIGGDFSDAEDTVKSVWIDETWRERFASMIRRAEARLNPADRGRIASLFSDPVHLERPHAAIAELAVAYPEAATTVLHPGDVPFFMSLCRTPGKPVNFVPVIDAEVRRWWRSDSLWQAHDPRYSADQVCVIPGTVSVAGITKADEPVADILKRFEDATVEAVDNGATVKAVGAEPVQVTSRRRADADGALGILLAAPDAIWGTRLTKNPVFRIGPPSSWEIVSDDLARHAATGAVLRASGQNVAHLECPVPGGKVSLRLTVPASCATGGAPIVTAEDTSAAMSALLEIAAGGGELPAVVDGVAEFTTTYQPELVADHAAVTATGIGSDMMPGTVPDVLVGTCWPAVFAAIGAAEAADGSPCVEGLLDLVHLDHNASLLSSLPTEAVMLDVRAKLGRVVDAEVGRVIEVEVEIRTAGDVIATLTERFAIRNRTGSASLTDPVSVASKSAESTPRKMIRKVSFKAPTAMRAFARISGDHNPIHTSDGAAALAGLPGPIVHGMWLSAAAQHVLSGRDISSDERKFPAIEAWTTRFLSPVLPGDTIDVRVERISIDSGREIVEVTCKVGDTPVMIGTARMAPPRVVYAFPGQGIQHKGMGLDAMSRSKAARAVWERADAHTREVLGFSILAIVRDNPTEVKARGVKHYHPDGVLFLTQFTQVAMATLGLAQIAELKESGAFIEGAYYCGHSVGEYNALAAVAEVLPLEAVLELVFRRGSAMHTLVPRDAKGRSDYRLGAIRPSQAGIADSDVTAYIDGIAEETGEFLQVVNYNLRGSQYAIAGTVKGLEVLESDIDARRTALGGKRAFILVPGIDVPFHSSVLLGGVPEFREKLRELVPHDIDPQILVGRYIPNLVPRLFNLGRDFVQEIADLVDSDPMKAVLADFDSWTAKPVALCREILIELLAWQFASPVRWIETQDLLFTDELEGGVAVERFVEIGTGSAPTLANLAKSTLALPGFVAKPEVFNVERDALAVKSQDESQDFDDDIEDEPAEATAPEAAAAPAPEAAPAPAAPTAPAGGPRPDDLPFSAADATRALIASLTKLRPEQIGSADTIEALCDGVSSRRNQVLLDLGSELGLGAIDGAAEADIPTLSQTVNKLARTYKPFGPVLTDTFGDQLRKVFGPTGKRPAYIGDVVTDVWELGPGWVKHVTAELALATREGTSSRGGELGSISGSTADDLIDAAVQSVATRNGVTVGKPSAAGAGGGTVDSATVSALTESITGPDGVLASTARHLLEELGLSAPKSLADSDDASAELAELVAQELGSDWARQVAPGFDARKAVVFDDRWASAREDLAKLWIGDNADSAGTFTGTGQIIATQARWWARKAEEAGRPGLVETYSRLAAEAEDTSTGKWASEVAIITGASEGSIAAAVAGDLLNGGATVIATTSRLNSDRVGFYKELYRANARAGATLWVVPANMAAFSDVDALVDWIGSEYAISAGPETKVLKKALTPTMLVPFAAPRVSGDLADAGAKAELQMRVLLWSVEKMIGGLSAIGKDNDIDNRLHVLLPGSPNRGIFGGDGAYGESKAAFDAIIAKWKSESSWAQRVTFTHALIGWVRGTGLMGGNDPLVRFVEAAGVTTWSTADMAQELLKGCTADARSYAESEPVVLNLTGGLDTADLDLSALAGKAQAAAEEEAEEESEAEADNLVGALPPAPAADPVRRLGWSKVAADPADMVVIVGAGELGPYGSARTRFEMEVSEELSAAGVLELAWTTGLITWHNDPKPAWYDAESGDEVAEEDIWELYHDRVVEQCGIRPYENDGALQDGTQPLLSSVFLDKDLTFTVSGEAEARAFVSAAPDSTVIESLESGEWQVTRKAGTEIRVPRRVEMTRTVGAQIPLNFDATRWGIPAELADSIDRVALWNLVTTVDAFLSSGFTPSELLRWVHPAEVANTQGVGIGGMKSMRSLYIDAILGENRPNDILQEALPNVIAAHVVQSYVGSYGDMLHPVAACATAAVSVSEGFDKIKLGRAQFVVAGGFDDLGVEGITGFGDMNATAHTQAMLDKGIDPRRFSRANDRRRGGFVEANGGGTILLARGDVAFELGLPVLGVVGWTGTFGDGAHTSIPAPGIGALGAGRGGQASKLARELGKLGVTADDISVISKHDTSTGANDPNESELHERVASALGRSDGAPLFVVSQKSLTGHSKGGAAAFQMIGLCQVLAQGVVPPNRSLDCVDDVLAEHPHLVWVREALKLGDKLPLKVGLVTSLGFGHVSAFVAIVHQEAFLQALGEERAADYLARAGKRVADGRRRIAAAMVGGPALYERPENRRFESQVRESEAALLLDPEARLGESGTYPVAPSR